MDAKTAASHAATVQSIAAAVKTFHARRQPFRIHHGSTNSTRPAHGQPVVDISALNHVLHVDKAAKTVSVEPNVAMDGLLDAVLPHNLVPPVVMEFPGITAGGAFAGSAGESSSFRHGAFDAAVTCVEMVLANGDIIEASPTQNADLFAAAPGALGTLGIVTRLDLRLLDAESYVRVEYSLHTTVEATCAAVEAATHVAANDFVEGILFSATQGLVITGTMSRSIPIDAFVRTNRDLEAKVRALGGRKVLYSHAYYDEDDFWAIYGRAWYDELRLKYHATTLPTVYDKVRVDIEKERAKKGLVDRLAVKWPFAGLIGVASALRS
ncbi:Cytochrome b-245 heavy chain [Verticillium dahliae VDG2]|nr:Cytochrome b-245 heavy chain [Verticillium dahliae VDG2]